LHIIPAESRIDHVDQLASFGGVGIGKGALLMLLVVRSCLVVKRRVMMFGAAACRLRLLRDDMGY
jgi:hypothetical protein